MSKGILKVKHTQTVHDYWYLTCPEKCRKCECAVLDWSLKGDPKWGCELDECYHSSEQSTNSLAIQEE